MIFLTGTGRTAVSDDAAALHPEGEAMPLSAACGFAEEAPPAAPVLGPFRYMFRAAPCLPRDREAPAALDALAAAMVEEPPSPDDTSPIPAVFTYVGQFLDHDIAAPADLEAGLSCIDRPDLDPVARERVETGLGNLRTGRIGLDSLYGGGALQGDLARRLTRALRDPRDPACLRAGRVLDAGHGVVPLPGGPGDRDRDVPRAGGVFGRDDAPLSEAELRALRRPLRRLFLTPDGALDPRRALIGDLRNDENLVVSQLHLALIRFHNRVVATAHRFGGPTDDREALFDWARRRVTWTWQWIVLHEYLPTVCDPGVARRVVEQGAPLYRAFLAANPAPRDGLLPLPLEVCQAAFRFGHSTIRASYDWNRFFGRAVADAPNLQARAGVDQLFRIAPGMPLPGWARAASLPAHWAAEWERMVGSVSPALPDRAARPIDTLLALPLADMEDGAMEDPCVLRHQARHDLRHGYRLNLPSAQDCIAEINALSSDGIEPLTRDELLSGVTGPALRRGGFHRRTPLWFYVLKEAELRAGGRHLGPLGSRLVAETLAGLVISDPTSCWHAPGGGQGRWSPEDGPSPAGTPVTGIAELLRAAGLLPPPDGAGAAPFATGLRRPEMQT